MPRQRDPKRDEAFEIWKKHNGNITNRAIAEELKIPEKTIGGWKSKDKWNEKLNGVLQTKIRSTPNKKKKEKAETSPEIDNDELTERQRLFCLYYVKTFNATQSAIKAGYASESAHVEGSRLLRNVKVASEIKRIKSDMTHDLYLDAMDVLQKWIKIAFADMTDFVEFGREEVTDDLGNPYEVNRVKFKESSEVDGTLITEIKQGKDGVSVKLADKMKALEKLSLYFDLFPDNFKRKIETERLELEKQKASGDLDKDDELIDDWIEAVTDDEE